LQSRAEEAQETPGRWDWVKRNPVLRTAALIAAVTWAPGCGKDEPPVAAAKAYASAAQRGDSQRLLELIDSATAEYLQAAAERASDQIGGRRNVEPHEMLQVIDVDPRSQVARAELVSSTETTARVKLIGADGTEHDLDLVLEDGQWRVRLPLPRNASGTP
jgi:hypothetical protein